MSISRFIPPLDYLRAASRASLQSFELARLNHAANLKREIATLMDQWIQETSEATLARWMLDHHDLLHDSPPAAAEILSVFPEPPEDPLPDSPAPQVELDRPQPRFSDIQRRLGESGRCKTRREKSSAAG